LINLEKLPAVIPSGAIRTSDFLDVTEKDVMKASRAFDRKVRFAKREYPPHGFVRFYGKVEKGEKDPYEIYNFRTRLFLEMADQIVERNLAELAKHTDMGDPLSALDAVKQVPLDKPLWVVKLLKLHGYEKADLETWVAADFLLGALVGYKSEVLAREMVKKALGALGRK